MRQVWTPYNRDWLDHLVQVESLESLYVRLPRSADVDGISQFSQLKHLILKCTRHQENLNFLRGMDNLHSLCVSQAMGVKRLTPLGTLTQLRELYIDGTISGCQTVQSLAPLAKLVHLRYCLLLLRVEKKNRTIRHLYRLSELQFLCLRDDFAQKEYETLLRKLPHLDQISFNGGWYFRDGEWCH